MRIAFRVDSGSAIGSGHLVRCLTLASSLRASGADIDFISREHSGHLISQIKEAGFNVFCLPVSVTATSNDYITWVGDLTLNDALQTQKILKETTYDWLVIDHYGIDKVWEQVIRPQVKKIMVIDDLANRDHDCDILLDQNYFSDVAPRYKNKVSSQCRLLLGPYFALLQPYYAQLHAILPLADGQVRRVLVFFGACDFHDQTSNVLAALSHPDLNHLAVDIVIGANYPSINALKNQIAMRPGTTLHQGLPTLAGLTARADLGIGAGGSTTWERFCSGLPSLVISMADNQSAFTHNLAKEGFHVSLPEGVDATFLDWRRAILAIINQPERVTALARKGRQLVDGLGAKRLTRLFFGGDNLTLHLRRASASDRELLFTWINDPDVRLQSFTPQPISEKRHISWFTSMLASPDSLILIGEDEQGLPLGVVRFSINREEEEAIISISLDQACRGLGIAEKLLQKALNYWQIYEPGIKVVAEIRESNWRSQRLFKRLKFVSAPSRREGAVTFELIS